MLTIAWRNGQTYMVPKCQIDIWLWNLRLYFPPKYKQSRHIECILMNKFNIDVATIIGMYLPIFHDNNLCSSGVLVTDNMMKRFNQETEEQEIALVTKEYDHDNHF